MALQKTMHLENSFGETSEFQNCYIKAMEVKTSKTLWDKDTYSIVCSVVVGFFKEKNGKLLSKQSFVFVPSGSASDAIEQAYKYLKTLPEFAGAADV